jgi:peptidyl-prolyl cis-trans isomerase D
MAILERLRVKAGLLLAIVIGLALLAFVLSDFLDSGGSLFTRSKYEIAEVSGKSVPYTDYDKKVKELEEMQKLQSGQASLDEETMDQIRNVTWDNLIQDMLLDKQYEKLGLDVSSDELSDLIIGETPHPAIAQLFTDPQTGVLNRQALSAFMQRVKSDEEDSKEKTYYLFLEKEIERQRKNVKYLNLIRKGLYATKFEAQEQQLETSRSVDVDFVVKNFNTVSDSAIKISDKDISKYYNEHINQFKQKESRDISYIAYDVVPSQSDYQTAEKWINDIKPDFEKADDMIQFVNMESDVPFDEKNYSANELPDTLDKVLFNASVGSTFGPYFEENAFRISRLAAIKYLPDSVKARHILLRATQSNFQTVMQTADSLINLIKSGSDFNSLAMMYSSDGSAQSGGDLGWFKEGDMVKPFSDSCFLAKKGDIKKIVTQYGVHVVQIMDQSRPGKQVQVATLVKNVIISEETDHNYYMLANEFAGKNNTYDKFINAVKTEKLNLQSAPGLAPMDKRINNLEGARPVVSWAYKAEEKDISTVFKCGNTYVVAIVDKIREEGPAPLEDVRAEIENRVKQEKVAERLVAQFLSKMKSAKTIEDLAREMGLSVEPVSGLRFTASSLGNSGAEPKVVAAATSMEKGVISAPIIGENGVYVLSVNNITTPSEAESQATVNLSRNYVERNYAARTNYYAYEALKELAEIRDNRREFY